MRKKSFDAAEVDAGGLLRDLFPGAELSSDMPFPEFIALVVEHRQSEELFRILREAEEALDEEPLAMPPEFEEIYRRIAPK